MQSLVKDPFDAEDFLRRDAVCAFVQDLHPLLQALVVIQCSFHLETASVLKMIAQLDVDTSTIFDDWIKSI